MEYKAKLSTLIVVAIGVGLGAYLSQGLLSPNQPHPVDAAEATSTPEAQPATPELPQQGEATTSIEVAPPLSCTALTTLASTSASVEGIESIVNAQRSLCGVGLLSANVLLTHAAEAHLAAIVASGTFSHSQFGVLPWDYIHGVGYSYSYAGENLSLYNRSNEDALSQWMASPTHRANIVNMQYTETGVAVGLAKDGGLIIVQIFARPK